LVAARQSRSTWYVRRTRPALEQGDKPFERGAIPLGGDFDCAVCLIAHPSCQAEIDSAILSKIAEADALHSP